MKCIDVVHFCICLYAWDSLALVLVCCFAPAASRPSEPRSLPMHNPIEFFIDDPEVTVSLCIWYLKALWTLAIWLLDDLITNVVHRICTFDAEHTSLVQAFFPTLKFWFHENSALDHYSATFQRALLCSGYRKHGRWTVMMLDSWQARDLDCRHRLKVLAILEVSCKPPVGSVKRKLTGGPSMRTIAGCFYGIRSSFQPAPIASIMSLSRMAQSL